MAKRCMHVSACLDAGQVCCNCAEVKPMLACKMQISYTVTCHLRQVKSHRMSCRGHSTSGIAATLPNWALPSRVKTSAHQICKCCKGGRVPAKSRQQAGQLLLADLLHQEVQHSQLLLVSEVEARHQPLETRSSGFAVRGGSPSLLLMSLHRKGL